MSNTKSNRPDAELSRVTARAVAPHCAALLNILPRVHTDERGTISIISVIALMLFTVLLGMVINVGRHVDDKVKQQNAADAGTLSGGVVLARGMNSLAFSNHLLCDVFAITAFMREARDRNAEALTPDILAAWSTVAPIFEKAPFSKFQGLGSGIPKKIEAEREMVKTFSDFAASLSESMLPTMEQVLQQKLIPQFERALVQSVPGLAQQTMGEAARRYGLKPDRELADRGQTYGALWRLNPQSLQPVAQSGENDPSTRTLPVVDPDPQGSDHGTVPHADDYLQAAKTERERLSRKYLGDWNRDVVGLFDKYAKMSQFFGLWEIFTHGQLCKLLNEEYPDTNLPFQIRRTPDGKTPDEWVAVNARPNGKRSSPDWRFAQPYLETNFRFAGLAYRKPLREMFGKVFRNQVAADAITFSEVSLFIPQPRWLHQQSDGSGAPAAGNAGTFSGAVPADPGAAPPANQPYDYWVRENWPTSWSLTSQNWTVQLVPATAEGLSQVLQSSPGDLAPGINVPTLGAAGNASDIRRVNTH